MYPKKLIRLTFLIILLSIVSCHKEQAKPLSGEELTQARCSTCHFSMDEIYTKVKTPQQWDTTVERMYNINPELMTMEEAKLIAKHLKSLPPRAAKK